MAGPENAAKYKTPIFLVGSASAEFFADIGLCAFEAVKVEFSPNTPLRSHQRGILRLGVQRSGARAALTASGAPRSAKGFALNPTSGQGAEAHWTARFL